MAELGKLDHLKEQAVAGDSATPLSTDAPASPEPYPIFRGTFSHSIDDKGRVSIPSTFRQILTDGGQDTVVLTNYVSDGARCLEGFTLDAWRRFEQKLLQRSRFDPRVRTLENYYLARAALCVIDSSGRVNIPAHLRTYAGLEREVVFSASLHGFRVWDKRVSDLVFREAETALLEDPALFVDVDI